MANTTNFGWETPDDTDLVKDGAAAIRTLGSAIDTSLVDLKGGTTGQVLAKASNTDMDFSWVVQDDSNAIQNSIVDAKGDLISATSNDTPARLAVGTNGQYLQADSTTSTGLKWVTLAAGAYTSIATGTLSGASTTINSIPGTYTDLYLIVVNAYPATTGRTISVQMNGDTTASRHTQASYSANTGTATFNSTRWNAAILHDNNNTSNDGIATLRLYNYANTTTWKIGEWRSVNNYSTDTTRPNFSTGFGMYNQTGAITSIKIFDSDGGNLGGGTYTLYGVK